MEFRLTVSEQALILQRTARQLCMSF